MANPDLVEYIREALEGGAKEEDIQRALLESGWSEFEIKDAFAEYWSSLKLTTPKP